MNKAERLEEIRQKMSDLLSEAKELLRGEGWIWERAKAYWYGHLDTYINGGMRGEADMEDTVSGLIDKYEYDENKVGENDDE